tara:strand:- start:27 stop:365 length:339 start_codon:yes stop_codon:yes gene_type:complete
MKNLRNNVQLIGNLGAAPDVKTLENGKTVARMTIATKEKNTNQKGEKITATSWHQLVAWGKTAEIAEKYLQKGSQIAIHGKLSNRSYENDKGETKYICEVLVNEIQMLGGKS